MLQFFVEFIDEICFYEHIRRTKKTLVFLERGLNKIWRLPTLPHFGVVPLAAVAD